MSALMKNCIFISGHIHPIGVQSSSLASLTTSDSVGGMYICMYILLWSLFHDASASSSHLNALLMIVQLCSNSDSAMLALTLTRPTCHLPQTYQVRSSHLQPLVLTLPHLMMMMMVCVSMCVNVLTSPY